MGQCNLEGMCAYMLFPFSASSFSSPSPPPTSFQEPSAAVRGLASPSPCAGSNGFPLHVGEKLLSPPPVNEVEIDDDAV